MFDSYKDRFRKMEQRLAQHSEMQAENLALTQLQKLFGESFFMPLTSWSIAPTEVLHICNDIAINGRKCIVEFGAGYSTLCVARMLQLCGLDARFYSIENNVAWRTAMQGHLKRAGLADMVEVVLAPMAPLPASLASEGAVQWYDTARLDTALAAVPPVDLVVVDGPHGSVATQARYPALPYLQPKLAAQYAIFLDDAARPDEQEIARRWEALSGASVRNFGRYQYFSNHQGFDAEPFGHSPLS